MAEPFRGSTAGLSRQRLRGARYEQLHRDIYVLTPAVISLRTRVDAALLVFPDAVVSHQTAALLLGLPVDDDGLVHLTRPGAAAHSERRRVRVHRASVPSTDIKEYDGLRVTSEPRLFLDLAASLSRVDLVILADAVLRKATETDLTARLRRAHRVRGVRRAAAALLDADAGSDSPAETRTRLILHAAGFTQLRHGLDVHGTDGGWLARPDLADEEAKVALQYDGLVHLGNDPDRRRNDIDRDELLRQEGWQVVVLTAVDLRQPDRMVAKVTAAYGRAARSHPR